MEPLMPIDDASGLVRMTFSQLTLLVQPNGLPLGYGDYRDHAVLLDELALDEKVGTPCFVAVRWGSDWPVLVVAQRYSPAGLGWEPGVAVVPETLHLFVGAGQRLLCYDLSPDKPVRLW